ncbi:MAG: hypothetical protein Q8N60_02395 [Candidatus Diapherotrites archaeon]|nr:hypothetical protein [Candidatus Diapherotrites archaeon]
MVKPLSHSLTMGAKHAVRPSAEGVTGRKSRQLSEAQIRQRRKTQAKCRATSSKKAAERQQQAMDEIRAAYKPGWPFVPIDPRIGMKTRHGIALWLLRSGTVTAFRNEAGILNALEKLARKGEIALPPKTGFGGARIKKK